MDQISPTSIGQDARLEQSGLDFITRQTDGHVRTAVRET